MVDHIIVAMKDAATIGAVAQFGRARGIATSNMACKIILWVLIYQYV